METVCKLKEGYDIANDKHDYYLQVGGKVAHWSSDKTIGEIVDILLELCCALRSPKDDE